MRALFVIAILLAGCSERSSPPPAPAPRPVEEPVVEQPVEPPVEEPIPEEQEEPPALTDDELEQMDQPRPRGRLLRRLERRLRPARPLTQPLEQNGRRVALFALQVGLLGVTVGLMDTPLLSVGHTAVTDHVFVWGVNGLSSWNGNRIGQVLSSAQAAVFGLLLLQVSLALLVHRWRRWLVSSAGITAGVTVALACAHAAHLAPSWEAVILSSAGCTLVLAFVVALLACAVVSRRGLDQHAVDDARCAR